MVYKQIILKYKITIHGVEIFRFAAASGRMDNIERN